MASELAVERPMATVAAERILDSLSTAVVAFDRELRLVLFNPAAEMLFQTSPRKVLGRALTELLPHNRLIVRRLQHALAEGSYFTARSVRLSLPGKRRITVDCTVSALAEDPPGAALLVELTQVDQLLRIAREEHMLRRQSANRAVVMGLAHEIKNPLGGLRGAAQLLAHELADGELKEYTNVIIQEADRLRSLVDRMVGPREPLRCRSTNVHEILEHVCSLIRAENPRGLHIERAYDPSLPNLMADPVQLTQAVLNIVRNAVEAVNGSGHISLRTGLERQFTIGNKHHRLVLRADIADDGPGIPPELADSIFDPMVTSKPTGTGLGLAIAQDIVDRHNGLIECSSRPRETVFSIYLPLSG